MCATCGCTGKAVNPRTKASDSSHVNTSVNNKIAPATGKGK